MQNDTYDRLLWIGIALVVAAIAILPFVQANDSTQSAARLLGRANDRQAIVEARRYLLRQRYEPVESLLQQGRPQQALLKLEELSRTFPGDAHAFILRGQILADLGAPAEAASSFAQGIRLDGSYVDKTSPLSRRYAISRLVDGIRAKTAASSAGTASASPEMAQNLRYLQSRLAGGCE
ncbi:MAG: hypothetical protein HZC44_04425 [Geobacter sp.]|nr:hypothetical protein [Geobacter sp.]